MKFFLAILVGVFAASQSGDALFFGKKRQPHWNKLSVTFLKFSGLPMNIHEAADEGWKKISSCEEIPSFRGERYVKDDDYAVVLIFDSTGHIAGMQTGVPADVSGGQFRHSPFVQVGNKLFLTAYFIDPQTICKNPKRDVDYIGKGLFLQVGSSFTDTAKMPLKEDDVVKPWTKGRCFYGMGQHYWYNITSDMNCNDFYPVFLMYNGGRLNAFGWAMGAMFESKRYEHPEWNKLDWFFQKETKPMCLKDFTGLSTQHIYLERRPYLNFC